MVISLTAPWLLILELVSEGIGNRPILRAVLSIIYLEKKKKKSVTIPSSHSKIWCSALVIYPSNDEPQARMTQRKMIFPLPIFFASNFNKKYKIPSIHCSKAQSHPDSSLYFFFHCQSIVNSVDFFLLKVSVLQSFYPHLGQGPSGLLRIWWQLPNQPSCSISLCPIHPVHRHQCELSEAKLFSHHIPSQSTWQCVHSVWNEAQVREHGVPEPSGQAPLSSLMLASNSFLTFSYIPF